MIKIAKIVNDKFHFNDDSYFFIEYEQKRFAIPDKCPHRGGPLSLGKSCQIKGTIECPWHDNQFKTSALIKKSVNAIRVQDSLAISSAA
ncbi:MAG: Rieske (2Fe-2S) protein [Gammaproteobacteria bacterium]|nr:Rieske (2Fe-2S) protein [Gammaproteobacteria bacterium]